MSPKKHRSRLQPSGGTNDIGSSRPSSRGTSLRRNTTNSDTSVEDNPLVSTHVSSLSPETIRWIQRRKKATGKDSVSGQVLPSRAKKLKEIFDSLDPDGTGTISIKAMKAALRYVNHSSSSFLFPPMEGMEGSQSSVSNSMSMSISLASSSFSPEAPRGTMKTITESRTAAISAVAASHVPFQSAVRGGGGRPPSPPSPAPVRSRSASPGRTPRENSHSTSPDRLRGNKGLLNFFTAMDSNKDGVISFNDFLAAMTTEPTEQEQELHQNINPQEEFVDFATKHKRHKIIEFTKDSSKNDLEKYDELKKLFQLTYFTAGTIDLSVNDKLARVKSELQSHLKELRSESFLAKKRKELVRAREAMLFFDAQRKKHDDFVELQKNSKKDKSLLTSTRPTTPGAVGGAGAISSLEDIVYSGNDDVDRQIRKRFAQFALHNEHTYTPKVEEVQKTAKSTYFRQLAREEIDRLKNDKYRVSNLPPILPPVSLKERMNATSSASLKPKSSFAATRSNSTSVSVHQG